LWCDRPRYFLRHDTKPRQEIDIAGNDYFFAIGGDNDIEVVWGENGADLMVSYKRPERHLQERILRQAIIWDTLRISYREK